MAIKLLFVATTTRWRQQKQSFNTLTTGQQQDDVIQIVMEVLYSSIVCCVSCRR